MVKRSASIAGKLIIGNTILLTLVVLVFGGLTKLQGRRLDADLAEQARLLQPAAERARAAIERSALPDREALQREIRRLEGVLDEAARGAGQPHGTLTSVVLVGVLVLVLGIALNVMLSVRIAAPIRQLGEQAERFGAGDLGARVQISSRDEIGALARRFNAMAEEVGALLQDRTQRAILEKELEVASAVQGSLVPDTDQLDLPGIRVAGYFQPTSQCAGDWWDCFDLPDGRVVVVLGDATGHGAASAMITAAAKGAATALREQSAALHVPGLLKAINAAVHGVAKGRFVMTCFASIYDAKTRTLEYANAGHTFPFLVQGGKLRPLIARGNRLGEGLRVEFEQDTVLIEPGATLVWYTDGIIDAENASGEKYGERRFRAQIEMRAPLDAAQARDALLANAFDFLGQVAPQDDIVLIVGRVA